MIFKPKWHPNTNTRTSFLKLDQPLRKTNHGQKAISYSVPNIWNSLTNSLKTTKSIYTYKYKVKKHFLDRIKNRECNIYSYF